MATRSALHASRRSHVAASVVSRCFCARPKVDPLLCYSGVVPTGLNAKGQSGIGRRCDTSRLILGVPHGPYIGQWTIDVPPGALRTENGQKSYVLDDFPSYRATEPSTKRSGDG